jgi:REP element-mobilizing transposase RayT
MTRAREQQICCEDTPYYHCVSRVVRRAFLCGFDRLTQQNFDHRRQWVIDRLAEIDSVFCIDICAYAIMSNHYHLVLFIDKPAVEALTNIEVIERWKQLYSGPEIIERYLKGDHLSAAHHVLINETIDKWRERLADISWYMRTLNQFIACKANAEDKCTGRFWEGRFRSQALLDEQALLTCMAYVELNPIRAKIAQSPETSDYTSIQQRIEETSEYKCINARVNQLDDKPKIALRPFLANGEILNDQLPYCIQEYFHLVDWSGRAVRDNKRGAIDNQLPSILHRLGIDEIYWCEAMKPKANRYFSRAIGCQTSLRAYAKKLEIGWIKGVSMCSKLFPA